MVATGSAMLIAAVLAASSSTVIDAAMLVVGGTAWISRVGLLGAAYQSEMSAWVRAREMAYYLSLPRIERNRRFGFGTVAQLTSLTTALWTVAAVMVVAALGTASLALPALGPQFFRSELGSSAAPRRTS
jgi:Transmembrane secretion effector